MKVTNVYPNLNGSLTPHGSHCSFTSRWPSVCKILATANGTPICSEKKAMH